MTQSEHLKRISQLPIWSGFKGMEPLSGGITNVNYLVEDKDARYVVRLGDDIIEHQVMRFNELAASKAAHAAGISPKVVHSEPGILVLEFIESKPLEPEQVRDEQSLPAIVDLVKKCHVEIPQHLRGPALIFWVFHVVRDYGWTLREGDSAHLKKLPELLEAANRLEQAAGPYDLVFGHNDLLSANILDDGSRFWLVDWDYAGFNSPLFDLGGLASNNEFDEALERKLLQLYFGTPADDATWQRYQAMKCASLLRETMWSMVSEIHSKIEFDYAAYTAENLDRFERSYQEFLQT